MARDPRPSSRPIKCIVHFLDNSEATFDVDKKDPARCLLDQVFEHLELTETDYFGLQFSNSSNLSEDSRWLDPDRPIKKQVKLLSPYEFSFRVKYYVSDPCCLKEEYTRYHLFLQLTKDMVDGRLIAPYKTCVLLASYAVQSELGDYCPEEHPSITYLNEFRFVPGQTDDMLVDVAELHRKHRGLSPATCEMLYIDTARRLDTYGIRLFKAVWDQLSKEIQLGVSCTGLAVFQNSHRINSFTWSEIVKISFKRKQFFVHLRKDLDTGCGEDNVFVFNMTNYRSCKNLWKSCVEHHTFFSQQQRHQQQQQHYNNAVLQNDNCIHGISSSFTQRSMSDRPNNRPLSGSHLPLDYSADGLLLGQPIDRHNRSLDADLIPHHHHHSTVLSSNFTACPRASPASSSSSVAVGPQLHGDDVCDGFNSYLSLSNCDACGNATSQRLQDGVSSTFGISNHVHMDNGQDYYGGIPSAHDFNGLSERNEHGRPHSYIGPSGSSGLPNGFGRLDGGPRGGGSLPKGRERLPAIGAPGSASRSNLAGSRLASQTITTSMRATIPSETSSDDEGGFGDVTGRKLRDENRQQSPPSLSTSTGSFNERSPTEQFYDLPSVIAYNNTNTDGILLDSNDIGSCYDENHSGVGLITVHMKPDARGTFGFNVKGGCDQGLPIIVSRVAPGSPADLCTPRLTEGYQVLYINGRDVSQHTHAQVVQFIRASRETHSGELILIVRPNVYLTEECSSEPDYEYTPDIPAPQQLPTSSQGPHQLSTSMSLLQRALNNGTAVSQFEQVYRKKPGMTMNAAVNADNSAKNRYRDILPYDSTRVKLRESSHDYINANYVNMLISGSGVINRYIAAQGPLPETSADFWQMIWEQRSPLVVMLTTTTERGRVKCHQYWPAVNSTVHYGDLAVTCVDEEKTSMFEFRDFVVSRTSSASSSKSKYGTLKSSSRDCRDGGDVGERGEEGEEEHHVHQMQYLSWPDHGVPDDSSDFLDFVSRVRRNRAGVVEPIVVHCSAGIGRTGVLIAMETAMCMIEANQPVMLLDIVRSMRDQRAMLIQTSDQYKFVCQAIVKVYEEHIVEPADDLRR